MRPQQKLRVGMIGYGMMASSHLRAFKSLQAKNHFTGVADLDYARALRLASAIPSAIAVKDYRELFGELDAVIVALPHNLDFDVGVACLRAGKYLEGIWRLYEAKRNGTVAQMEDCI